MGSGNRNGGDQLHQLSVMNRSESVRRSGWPIPGNCPQKSTLTWQYPFMPIDEFRIVNRENWDSRVEIHYGSSEYATDSFRTDPTHISSIVAFDKEKLGPVQDKSLVHLQCHIGTDTLSWARLGANVTGIDFSEKAIAAAKRLSRAAGIPGRFIVSELYDTPDVVSEKFDIVYTGVGAICWLPDIRGWANVVAHLLRPGATFYMREGHPLMWALDEESPVGTPIFKYPYFEGAPTEFEEEETYAGSGILDQPRTYDWSHGIAETLGALIDSGLVINRVEEYDFCEWQGTSAMVEIGGGRWSFPPGHPRLPLMWSVLATKS